MTLAVVDLFAGCGGLASGLEDSSLFTTVLAVERDTNAAETFAANIDTEVVARPIGMPSSVSHTRTSKSVPIMTTRNG